MLLSLTMSLVTKKNLAARTLTGLYILLVFSSTCMEELISRRVLPVYFVTLRLSASFSIKTSRLIKSSHF